MADNPTARVTATRAELAATLDELGDRLDPRTQLARLSATARASWRRNPVPWIVGGGLAAALVVGAVFWAFVADD